MFKSGKCPKSLNENHNIRKKEGILMLNIYYGDMKEAVYNTSDTYLAYMKKRLNPAYLQDVIKETILEKIEKISLTWKK